MKHPYRTTFACEPTLAVSRLLRKLVGINQDPGSGSCKGIGWARKKLRSLRDNLLSNQYKDLDKLFFSIEKIASSALIVLLVSSWANAASITIVPFAKFRDISGDGQVAVGRLGSHAGAWDALTGEQIWEESLLSDARASNLDGSRIGGHAPSGAAIFDTVSDKTTSLEVVDSWLGQVADISPSGEYAVGYIERESLPEEAFIWNESSGLTKIGYLENGTGSTLSIANAVSEDGSVVAGYSNGSAFRWTADAGMVDFLGVPGSARAIGITPDGETIVGSLNDEAFRWSDTGGLDLLGTLYEGDIRYKSSRAEDISADGLTIVGTSFDLAFLYRDDLGLISLNDLLLDQGVDLGEFSLVEANGISDDGRSVAGLAINSLGTIDGFIAHLDEIAPDNHAPSPNSVFLLLLGLLALRLSHVFASRTRHGHR